VRSKIGVIWSDQAMTNMQYCEEVGEKHQPLHLRVILTAASYALRSPRIGLEFPFPHLRTPSRDYLGTRRPISPVPPYPVSQFLNVPEQDVTELMQKHKAEKECTQLGDFRFVIHAENGCVGERKPKRLPLQPPKAVSHWPRQVPDSLTAGCPDQSKIREKYFDAPQPVVEKYQGSSSGHWPSAGIE